MMSAECINLKERYGGKYRVTFEESYRAERPEFRAAEAVLLMIIPAAFGHFFPWDSERIGFATDKSGAVANRLKSLDFATVVQDGSDGATVVFPFDRFPEVATIVKPRKRRRLSEAGRRKLAEAGREYRFRGVGSDSGGRESNPRPHPDGKGKGRPIVDPAGRKSGVDGDRGGGD